MMISANVERIMNRTCLRSTRIVSKFTFSILIALCALLISVQATARKIQPTWPLEVELSTRGQLKPGSVFQLELHISKGEWGPIESVDAILVPDSELHYSGQRAWNFGIDDSSDYKIRLDIEISPFDTAGFELTFDVRLANGTAIKEPFPMYFISTASSVNCIKGRPIRLSPGLWISRYGTKEQRDSLFRHSAYQSLLADSARKAQADNQERAAPSLGTTSVRLIRPTEKLKTYLQRLHEKELTPFHGSDYDYYEISGVIFGRLPGESRFSLIKPYTREELYELSKKGIRATIEDRFVDSIRIFIVSTAEEDVEEIGIAKSRLEPTDSSNIFALFATRSEIESLINNETPFDYSFDNLIRRISSSSGE